MWTGRLMRPRMPGNWGEGSERPRISKPTEWLAVTHWLHSGDLEPARRWAEQVSATEGTEVNISPPQRESESIILARVFIAAGDADKALQVLTATQQSAQTAGRYGLLIEIAVLRAMALHNIGLPKEAIRALKEALTLAEPGVYVRLFLDEGAAVRDLLQEVLERDPAAASYAARLLAHFAASKVDAVPDGRPASSGAYLLEPLSDREVQVLRLLVSGLSGQEIASALTVGMSTVKTHIKNIYSKLGVHTRLQAADRARDLMLF